MGIAGRRGLTRLTVLAAGLVGVSLAILLSFLLSQGRFPLVSAHFAGIISTLPAGVTAGLSVWSGYAWLSARLAGSWGGGAQ